MDLSIPGPLAGTETQAPSGRRMITMYALNATAPVELSIQFSPAGADDYAVSHDTISGDGIITYEMVIPAVGGEISAHVVTAQPGSTGDVFVVVA